MNRTKQVNRGGEKPKKNTGNTCRHQDTHVHAQKLHKNTKLETMISKRPIGEGGKKPRQSIMRQNQTNKQAKIPLICWPSTAGHRTTFKCGLYPQ